LCAPCSVALAATSLTNYSIGLPPSFCIAKTQNTAPKSRGAALQNASNNRTSHKKSQGGDPPLPSKRMVGTYHPNNFFFDGDVGDGELSSAREANSGPFDMKRVNNVYTTARKLYSQVGKIYSCPVLHRLLQIHAAISVVLISAPGVTSLDFMWLNLLPSARRSRIPARRHNSCLTRRRQYHRAHHNYLATEMMPT
jgi:hypothetical protein